MVVLKEAPKHLRGDYAHANSDGTINFDWESFTTADHDMWRTLFKRTMPVVQTRACAEYLLGIEQLGLAEEDGIPHFGRVNERLMKLTGWQIVTVPGLVAAEHFFPMLAARKFPMTTFIRTPEEIDYLQEPDIFHEMFGHVAMLANPIFANYSEAFGRGGIKAQQHGYLPYLEALYWFTIEFGLVNTPEGARIYGGGIASSVGESIHCLSEKATHIAYDVKRIMRQKYRIDTYQNNYFVIDSFEQLLESTTPDFLPYYREIEQLPLVEIEQILPTDVILQKGV